MFRFTFGRKNSDSGEQRELKSTPVRALPSKEDFSSLKASGDLPWTSSLSVAEWLSLRKLSLTPLGQVMGSSVFHIGFYFQNQGNFMNSGFGGYQNSWSRSSYEIREPTQALYDSRSLALERMRQEASRLGANAVVDVRLLHKNYESTEGMVEFTCIGTAIRVEGIAPLKSPLICSVPGEDLLRLIAAGSFPMGFAIGASYYYLATSYADRWQETSFYNQEMQHFTNGFYDARHFAQKRLRDDANRIGADGVVGVDYTYHVEEIKQTISGNYNDEVEVEDHIIEFVIFGTAISRSKTYHNVLGSGQATLDLRR